MFLVKHQRVRRYLGAIFLVCITLWFGWLFYQDSATWGAELAHLNYQLLGISYLLLATVFLLQAWIWRLLIMDFGYALSLRNTFQTLFISSLGRYVPGRIWQFSAAVFLLRGLGVPVTVSAAVSVLAQLITMVAGILVALPVFFLWLGRQDTPFGFLASSVIVCALLIPLTLFPQWWLRSLNYLLGRFGRPPIPILLTRTQLWKYLGLYLIVWLDSGLAFFVFMSALASVDWNAMPLAIAASAFGYVVGYLVIFSPGGLGAREGALILALTLFLPLSQASLASLGSRLWLMSVEVLLGIVAFLLYNHQRTQKSRELSHGKN